jgi:hypothetical protein
VIRGFRVVEPPRDPGPDRGRPVLALIPTPLVVVEAAAAAAAALAPRLRPTRPPLEPRPRPRFGAPSPLEKS